MSPQHNPQPAASSCPTEAELVQFAQGVLSEPETEYLARHLDGCAVCQARLAAMDEAGAGAPRGQAGAGVAMPYVDESQCRRVVDQVGGQVPPSSRAPADGGAGQGGRWLEPGTVLGKYEVVAQLDEGAMGKVYRGRHRELGTVYAIKVLQPGRTGSRQAVERFLREMEAIGQLDHPNIVRAVDAGEERASGEVIHYLVMEYVPGVSLAGLVRDGGRLGVAEACEVVRQVAEGLAHAHAHGRVHRDIKPSNVMVDWRGVVKVLDLGLALLQPLAGGGAAESLGEPGATGSGEPPEADGNLTGSHQVMGTARYMAPEQAANSHAVDERADIYSLGCTFYALLAGEPPFAGPKYRSVVSLILAHTGEAVRPIRDLRPDVPEGVAAVLTRMLAKRPEDRYASAAHLARDLAPFAAGARLDRLAAPVGPPAGPEDGTDPFAGDAGTSVPRTELMAPSGRPAARRRGRWLGMAGLGTAAAAVLVAWALWPRHEPGPVAPPPPPPPGFDGNVLAALDLSRDVVAGPVAREESGLDLGAGSQVVLPFEVPREYRLHAAVRRLAGEGGLVLGLLVDGWPCRLHVDRPGELSAVPATVLEVDAPGSLVRQAAAGDAGSLIAGGEPCRLVCTVRVAGGVASVSLEADAREVASWQGKVRPDRAAAPAPVAGAPWLSVGATGGSLRVEGLRLEPLTGPAQPVAFADRATQPDLAAAQRFLWKGGRVWVNRAGTVEEVRTLAGLADGVRVEQINGRGCRGAMAEDLAYLAGLAGLRELSLAGWPLGDGSAGLRDLAGLEVLDLSSTAVPPGLLTGLAGSPVRRLVLRGAAVEEGALASLPAWATLEEVDLGYSTVKDEGVGVLARLPGLARLKLDHTAVSDRVVGGLQGLGSLRELSLAGTGVTDAAVEPLARLGGLKELSVLGTGLSAAAGARLQDALPGARVTTGSRGTVDLLGLIDLPWGMVQGPWRTEAGRLLVGRTPEHPAKLRLPVSPPEEYDLDVVVRSTPGGDPLVFLVQAGGREVTVGFDHGFPMGGYVIVHGIDGKIEKESSVIRPGRTFLVGRDVAVAIRVRKDRLVVLRDGQEVISWPANYAAVMPYGYYSVSTLPVLGVSAWDGGYVFSKWTLTPVSGVTRLLPVRPSAHSSWDLARKLARQGGRVEVTWDGESTRPLAEEDLRSPPRPFWIKRVTLPSVAGLAREDVVGLAEVPTLEGVSLAGLALDRAGFRDLVSHVQAQGQPFEKAMAALLSPADTIDRDYNAVRDLDHSTGAGKERNGAWGMVPGVDRPTICVWGPYTPAVPAGAVITASYRLKVDGGGGPGVLAAIDIYDADGGRVLARRDLRREDFQKPGEYQDFALRAWVPSVCRLEYRLSWSGLCRLSFERVRVTMPRPLGGPWQVREYSWSEPWGKDVGQRFRLLETAEPRAVSTRDVLDLRWRTGPNGEPPPAHFATIAEGRPELEAGRYEIRGLGDDLVRVLVDGHLVIDRSIMGKSSWPPRDAVEVELGAGRHEIRVEHLQHTGGADLQVVLNPVRRPAAGALAGGLAPTGPGIPGPRIRYYFADRPAGEGDLAGAGGAGRPAGDPVDLLTLIRAGQKAGPGEGLICDPRGAAVLAAPYLPPKEYRVEAVIERARGQQGPTLGLVVGGRRCLLALDRLEEEGLSSGLEGLRTADMRRSYRGEVLTADRPTRVGVQVTRAGPGYEVRVEREGRPLFALTGTPEEFAAADDGAIVRDVLVLQARQGPVKVLGLQLVPLGGEGRAVALRAPGNDRDRAAALRVLWLGGRVWVKRAGGVQEVRALADLEGEAFAVERIDGRECRGAVAADLAYLAGLTGLRELSLAGWPLGDGSPGLRDLPGLEVLDLSSTAVPPGLWAGLVGSPVRRLVLRGAAVGDGALASLPAWAGLEEIDLGYSTVTDEGVRKLGRLPGLARLNLDHTAVSDRAAGVLKEITTLKELSLDATALTNGAVEDLARLGGLGRLSLVGTAVGAAEAARLETALVGTPVVTGSRGAVDLLALVDLPWGSVQGQWRRDGEGLAIAMPQAEVSKLRLPVVPPEEYNLDVVVRQTKDVNTMVFTVVAGGRQGMVGFDHWPMEGGYVILHGVDDRHEKDSEVKWQGRAFRPGQDVRITIRVRRERLVVVRDGREVLLNWAADYSRLWPNRYFAADEQPVLAVAGWNGSTVIRSWTLTPISGQVRLLPVRPSPGSSCRGLAQGVLRAGGRVVITGDGLTSQQLAGAGVDLPATPVWLREVDLPDASGVTEADLVGLAAAPDLLEVRLGGVMIPRPRLPLLVRLLRTRVAPAKGLGGFLEPADVQHRDYNAARDLDHSAGREVDGGWVMTPGVDQPGYNVWGPKTITVPTGAALAATFRLKVEEPVPEGVVATIDVHDIDSWKVLGQREVRGEEFRRAGEYQDFTVRAWSPSAHQLEYRVVWPGRCRLSVERVRVSTVRPVCGPWQVRHYPWQAGEATPVAERFRRLESQPPRAVERHDWLDLRWGGPGADGAAPEPVATVATSRPVLMAGRYELRVMAADAVRVLVDGRVVVHNEASGEPLPLRAAVEVDVGAGPHEIRVEHVRVAAQGQLQLALNRLPSGPPSPEEASDRAAGPPAPEPEPPGPRLRHVLAAVEDTPPERAGPALDLLPLLGGVNGGRLRAWSLRDGALVSAPEGTAVLRLPYGLPEQYRLEATVVREEGREGPVVGLVVGGKRCFVAVDGRWGAGYRSGHVPWPLPGGAENFHWGEVLRPGEATRLTLTVSRSGEDYEVRLGREGRVLFAQTGSAHGFAAPVAEASAARGGALLVTHGSRLTFRALRLVPLSGGGPAAAPPVPEGAGRDAYLEDVAVAPARDWLGRGRIHAGRGEWEQAAADFARGFAKEAPSNPLTWLEHACLRVRVGDLAGYREVCGRMRERFKGSNSVDDLAFLAHACVLAPDALGDPEAVVGLARERLSRTPPSGHASWSPHVLGLALYRARRYAEAEEVIGQALRDNPDWQYRAHQAVVLGLACHKQGRSAEAREWLGKADVWAGQGSGGERWSAWPPPFWPWRDWAVLQFLRREAGDPGGGAGGNRGEPAGAKPAGGGP